MTTLILAAQQAAQSGGGMGFLIMMVAMFAIMWFFMIRPQQKKQKEIQKFQNSLEKGERVLIGGGIYGTVRNIDLAKGIVEVDIASGVTIRVDKGSVYKDASDTAVAKK